VIGRAFARPVGHLSLRSSVPLASGYCITADAIGVMDDSKGLPILRLALHHLAYFDRKLPGFVALTVIHRLDLVGHGNPLLGRRPCRDLL
jgi:hypothetical protein